ncbi:MAG: dihydrolipoyl dehydrogenase, partial [Bacteroidales bacterium]|nr:dihydrolipoyl dehydrogenase [Bacteroidales bacterium]
MNYDMIIIGSGPGGYVAAIRASQLGKKVAVVERAELGGICLNWGCIPAKSLLKSAKVYENVKNAVDYGVKINGDVSPDIIGMIERSRAIADEMSKGIQFLFKKNKIDHIKGFGKLAGENKVRVESDNGKYEEYVAPNIILATGARPKELSSLKLDGKKIIGYREAITLNKMPESMIIVGSGAIGSEFAYFYNSIGVDVTLVEFLPDIVPLEDEEVSKQLGRSFKKAGMKVMTGSFVEQVDITGEKCKVTVKTSKGEKEIEADIVLSAVGISPNLENIGLEEIGIEMDKDKVKVDEYYQTNVKGIYAIGDIVHGQSLAHVASAEGIICVESISGKAPGQLDYKNIPSCTYTSP